LNFKQLGLNTNGQTLASSIFKFFHMLTTSAGGVVVVGGGRVGWEWEETNDPNISYI
jgi:hypothetical protein